MKAGKVRAYRDFVKELRGSMTYRLETTRRFEKDFKKLASDLLTVAHRRTVYE
jgi:hypothetical protein